MVRSSETYLAELGRILDRIRMEQREAIAEAAAVVARAIAGGGVVHVFGSGHSHLLAEEMFYRAGGLAAINPILDDRLTFVRGALASTRAEREPGLAASLLAGEDVRSVDAAIIVSNSGRNTAPIEMAREFSRRGVATIAITNVAQSRASASRHESGLRLFELADVVVDTCVPFGDAVVSDESLPLPMGPASTVAGAAIVHAIAIEAAATLEADGQHAPVLPSANVDGTTEQTLEAILRPYRDRVRYLDVDG